jgi:hypothetical protein
MGGTENKRQKKLAQRKSKRKKALLHKKKVGELPGSAAAEKLFLHSVNEPLFECVATAEMFEVGIGNVLISRRRSDDGRIAVSVFLVDLLCLGVKNAMFDILSPLTYEATLTGLELLGDLMEVPPECARKLVEGAVAYAEDLGFSPQHDYRIAYQIFGDIDKTECETSFEFGLDGKPMYFSGPNDSPGDIQRILNQLEKRCGPDGFDFTIADEADDLESI